MNRLSCLSRGALFSTLIAAAACAPSTAPNEAVATESAALTGPTITLISGSSTQAGYDFHAAVYDGPTGGDFYFYGGAFWANNVGQRGLVDVGPSCPALTVAAMPTSGYSSDVPAVAGHCYVSLTKGDTRDFVVFQVSTASSGSTSLVWALVTSGDSGVTLTNSVLGYDFATRTYVGATGGDFYFWQGELWANNYDERGIVSLGPCDRVEDAAAAPASGYLRGGVSLATGNCYASPTSWDPRHRIVFHVDYADTSSTTLTWRLVETPVAQMVWQHCDPYVPARLSNTGIPANILASWLAAHPTIENAMQWIQPTIASSPVTVGYTSWPANMQSMLTADYVGYWNWYNSGMTGADPDPRADPPPNQATTSGGNVTTAFSTGDAQSLYVRYLALSLVVEIQGRVPWSLTSYSAPQLAELLDARKFFTQYTSQGYTLMALTVTPAPPLVAAQFIAQNNLLCANRPATIAETTFWARNLSHYNNTSNPAADEVNFWQYAGAPPASRVLAGTSYTGSTPNVPTTLQHWTMGCHGTTGLLKDVLRAVNIPVEHFSNENPSPSLPNDAFYASGHAATHFIADGLWLSHGDDPYFVGGFPMYNKTLPFPLQAMLLSDAQFFATYPNPGTWTGSMPIGFQPDVLWATYGDSVMLALRYMDLTTNPTPPDQNICSWFTVNANNSYSCAAAEADGLLQMLDPLVSPYPSLGSLDQDIAGLPPYYPPLPETQGVLNGSFSDGLSSWTTSGNASIGATGFGDGSALVLGATTAPNGNSSAWQTFAAPAGISGISLWMKESCVGSVTTEWATVTLTDQSSGGAVIPVLGATCGSGGWTHLSAPIAAGHVYLLTLTFHDGSQPADAGYTIYDAITLTTPSTPASGITNGSFGAGLTGWTASGASVQPVAQPAVQLGASTPTNGDSTVVQSFVAPAGTSQVSLYYEMTCPDTVTYDWAKVTLVDQVTGATTTLLPPTCITNAWTSLTAAVTAGHAYTLTVTSHDDDYYLDPSYTLVDGVSLH